MNLEYPSEKISFARQLRRTQSPFERELWKILRARQMPGFHFRRQHPIGPYVADFVCTKAKLVVELDGDSHDQRLEYDAVRDEFMKELGWRILRLPNAYVRSDPDGLWRMIEIALKGSD